MVASAPMPTVRERAAALRPEAATALPAGILLLLVAALFAGDSTLVHAAALAAAAVVGGLAALGRLRLSGGVALVAALVALAAWNGLSVAWSIAPDLSWAELNRGLLYAAFAGLGAILGSQGPRALRVTALVVGAALAAAILWALAGKAIPALFPDGGRAARLRDPIGYWNALALAADALLVLALWVAAGARDRRVRAAGAVVATCAVVAVLLSASRAGVAAGVVGVLAWLLLGGGRVERALLAVAATVPGFAVAAFAFTRPGLVEDGQELALRVSDGRLFAGALVLGAGAAAGLALLVERINVRGRRRRLLGRSLAAGLAGVLCAGVVAAAAGDPLDGEAVPQGPGRLADAGLNNRRDFWVEALRIARNEPLTGTGAGTFELARRAVRDDATSAVEPHNVALQFLAGTGPVGAALFLLVGAAVAVGAAGALRRVGPEERRAAAALAVVPLVYGVHALVDYDWNFPSVTAPTLVAAGALAAAGRERLHVPGAPFVAAAIALLAAAAIVSTALPWLAERSLREATRLAATDPEAALEAAQRAQSLDPLSIRPLQTEAAIHAGRRHVRRAREAYAEAVRLQPRNPETWYELGIYEVDRRLLCQAYRHLNEAYTLDPKSTRWTPGGPLDVARDAVNAGRCG